MDNEVAHRVRAMFEAHLLAQSMREMTKSCPLGDYAAEAFAQILANRLERNDAAR